MAFQKTWTEEQEKILRELWANHLPARLIGEKLGKSKSAIIGKADRLDLPSAKGRTRPPRPVATQRRAPAAFGTPQRLKRSKAAHGALKSMAELLPNECRWPSKSENGKHLFCAGEKMAGQSYCPDHKELSRRNEYTIAPKPQNRGYSPLLGRNMTS